MEWLIDDDEYRVVLVDNGTELGEFAWHESLKGFGVGSPADMEDRDNRFRPYTKIADLMRQALDATVALKFAKKPKHVGIAWHLQPTKDDTVAYDKSAQAHVKKTSSDKKAAGSEYLGDYLPTLQGGFRRKIAAMVDGVVYTHVFHERPKRVKGKSLRDSVGSGTRPHYMIQVVADEERMASVPGPLPPEMFIDNDWACLKPLLGVHEE